MHGLWYQRSGSDLVREAIIHLILSLLYVPAIKIKCATSIVIVTLISLQHLASLLIHPDGFIPPEIVLPGAALLGLMGYFKSSSLLFFTGLYSVLSKVNYLKLVVSRQVWNSMDDWADIFNEISKLVVSLLVWALFSQVWNVVYFKRLASPYNSPNSTPLPGYTPSTKTMNPRWFSEFIVPYEMFQSWRGWVRVGDSDLKNDGDMVPTSRRFSLSIPV